MANDVIEPELANVTFETAMQALADQTRLEIIRLLARDTERTCGTFDLGVGKATRSHHFKILREAGITHTRTEGTTRHVSLRRDEFNARFPGLLDAVIAAAGEPLVAA
jgi:DNA-binding transcriptional ArsR family regulator